MVSKKDADDRAARETALAVALVFLDTPVGDLVEQERARGEASVRTLATELSRVARMSAGIGRRVAAASLEEDSHDAWDATDEPVRYRGYLAIERAALALGGAPSSQRKNVAEWATKDLRGLVVETLRLPEAVWDATWRDALRSAIAALADE